MIKSEQKINIALFTSGSSGFSKSMVLWIGSNSNLRFCITILLTFLFIESKAQDSISVHNPPVNTEFLFGSRGMANQTIIMKKLQSVPRLGYVSIINFTTEWDTKAVNDYMFQGNLS